MRRGGIERNGFRRTSFSVGEPITPLQSELNAAILVDAGITPKGRPVKIINGQREVDNKTNGIITPGSVLYLARRINNNSRT